MPHPHGEGVVGGVRPFTKPPAQKAPKAPCFLALSMPLGSFQYFNMTVNIPCPGIMMSALFFNPCDG